MAAMGIVSGSATLEERAEWLVDSSFRHIVSNKDDQLFIAEKIAEEIRNAVIASKVEGK